jgi:hypothetical protein
MDAEQGQLCHANFSIRLTSSSSCGEVADVVSARKSRAMESQLSGSVKLIVPSSLTCPCIRPAVRYFIALISRLLLRVVVRERQHSKPAVSRG